MVSPSAVSRDDILIDGNRYRVLGNVQQFLASRPPGKVTIGDYSDASNPMASEFSLGDFRDGIGINRGDIETDLHRAWWGTNQLRYRDSVILPKLATATANDLTGAISALEIFDETLYAVAGTDIHSYDVSGDSWSASVRSIAAAATDTAVGILYPSGTATNTFVVANGTDVDYSTDGTTWAQNTGQAIKYLVFWGDLLWGITNGGALFYTDDLASTWTADAQLPLPAGSVTGLLIARGPDREQHIYAVTKQGLWVHDDANARFLRTDLVLPLHPDGGKGHAVWRGNVFVSAGNAIYIFQAGSDATNVSVVGPDLGDGLPQERAGVIAGITDTHNELMAYTDITGTSGGASQVTVNATRGVRFHHGVTFPAATGTSSILGWNGRGWEVKWVGDAGRAVTAMVAGVESSLTPTYRLWWASDQRVYYMTLPIDVVNPVQIGTQDYASSGTLETPWFDMGTRNQQKLALAAILDTINPSSDETVTLEYATNLVETYTTVVAGKDETGEVEYRLPVDGERDGVPFRYWKWRVTLNRGTTTTNTPQLVRITLVFRRRVETLYGVSATLDLTQEYNGVPPIQQFLNLRASMNRGTLIEVAYTHNESGEQSFLMDPLDYTTSEEAGSQGYGTARVTLAEPLSTAGDFLHERA